MSNNRATYGRRTSAKVAAGHNQDELIERLHHLQLEHGYLSRDLLRQVAQELDIPPSRVYGVASFYHAFRLEPHGDKQCTVCTGTSCHIKGGSRILRELEQRLGIASGETTADNRLSLDSVRCLGKCELAPLVVVNDRLLGQTTTDEICDLQGFPGNRGEEA